MSDEARKVMTPEAIASYPHVFVARPGPDGGEPKFSCSFVFVEGTDLKAVKAAIIAAAKEKWGDKAIPMIKAGQLRMPLRTEWEDKGYPENSVFITCSSKQQPGIVHPYAGSDGKPAPLTDPNEIYPGAIVRASLRAFGYDKAGNKGVSFALNNLQKLRDGDRLDGRVSAANEFDVVEGVADLDDVSNPSAEDIDDFLG